ncbi:MAG: hypothetical protein WCP93_03775 [Candidatus Berkelbacteria bacterium]
MSTKREEGNLFGPYPSMNKTVYFEHDQLHQDTPIQNLESEIAQIVLENGVPHGFHNFLTICGAKVFTTVDVDYSPNSTASQTADLHIVLPTYIEMIKMQKKAGFYQYEQTFDYHSQAGPPKIYFWAKNDTEAKKIVAKKHGHSSIGKIDQNITHGMILNRIDLDENDKIIKISVGQKKVVSNANTE